MDFHQNEEPPPKNPIRRRLRIDRMRQSHSTRPVSPDRSFALEALLSEKRWALCGWCGERRRKASFLVPCYRCVSNPRVSVCYGLRAKKRHTVKGEIGLLKTLGLDAFGDQIKEAS